MPCGVALVAARADADRYRASLCAVAPRAIRSARAYAVDANAHFSRAGPRVADGVELLAALLHPDIFPGASVAGRAVVWA
jgi:iron complex transport system substrate-binding protein